MYGTMARLQAMDQIFYNAQRQGRVSFYMTSTGEVRVCGCGVCGWMDGWRQTQRNGTHAPRPI